MSLTERATMSKSDVYNAVMGKIAKRLGREPRIVYELGGNPASGKVVDNLDEIAFRGLVMFIEIRQSLHGFKDGKTDSIVYTSPVTHNPTFLDVAACADDMLHVMGDEHHVFLSRVSIIGNQYDDNSGIVLVGFTTES